MASSEFVEITATANAVEAEYLRGVFEECGLSAFVDGAHANTTLSHIGSALGGVKVFVRQTDVEKALEIIEDIRAESDTSGEPWFCGACEESIDGSFAVCWSCGQDRSLVERPFPDTSGDDAAEDILPDPPPMRTDEEEANPYTSPKMTETTTPDLQQLDINEEVEEMVQSAWRAAVLGGVYLPVFMHIYSIYLLFQVSKEIDTFSQKSKKRFYGAIAVNILAFCVFGLMIAMIFRW